MTTSEIDRFGEPNFEVSGRRFFLIDFLLKSVHFGPFRGPGKPGADLGRFGTVPERALGTTRSGGRPDHEDDQDDDDDDQDDEDDEHNDW